MLKRNKFICIIFSICLILSSLLLSVHFWCFNIPFYNNEHDKIILYDKSIAEHIGINNEELEDLTKFVLDYLNDPSLSLDKQMNIKGIEREVFTENEKIHMVDVRTLNLNSMKLCYICLVICLITLLFIIFKKIDIDTVFVNYKKVLINIVIIFGFIGFWVILDFDSFWTLFHRIFFAGNDLWILDLRTDILIMIVPPQFFNDLVIRIVATFIIAIILFSLVLYFIRRKKTIND